MSDTKPVMERYHARYDNNEYQAVTQKLADALHVERDSSTASDAANLVTDAALGLCGHPSYTNGWRVLAVLCGQQRIPADVVDALHTYLSLYAQNGDTAVDDFAATVKALTLSYTALDALQSAVPHANGIHGWQGRAAYQLLATSDYLVQAAIQLLGNGDESYISEKLHHGVQRLTGALHEAVRYSPRPDRFDFSETVFPVDLNEE